jgi:hypothetical protein
MQHNAKFDEVYKQAFTNANWSAIVRHMQVEHVNADENGAKHCANEAYAAAIENGNCLEAHDIRGVRVEFFVYNEILFCRISYNSRIAEGIGHCDL